MLFIVMWLYVCIYSYAGYLLVSSNHLDSELVLPRHPYVELLHGIEVCVDGKDYGESR